jgi:hypothetical protein
MYTIGELFVVSLTFLLRATNPHPAPAALSIATFKKKILHRKLDFAIRGVVD